MQMHPPNQLRQIHEERIARYIKREKAVKPPAQVHEKEHELPETTTGWPFNLLKQPKKATEG